MRLFVAEKPSLARTIAEGLGHVQKMAGYLQCGKNDLITWCFGHLLDLAQPEAYHKAWGNRYDRSILPIVPEKVRLTPRTDSGIREQLRLIDNLLKQADLVVNAGDPDREGQLLVDEVLEFLNYHGPTQRIFLAALDPRSVARALARLEDNEKYTSWRDAAATRRIVDWLAGINMSRAMTIFGNSIGLQGVLSLGRVQTPTLRLVVDRDRQIANFQAVDYAQLVASMGHALGPFKALFKPAEDLLGLDPDGRLTDFSVAEKICAESLHLPGTITKLERKNGQEWAKLPYSLASLQVDAAAKFSLSAQQVLNIAQKLYESKLTTYPRTDCEYLPEEQFADAPEIIQSLCSLPKLGQCAKGANPSIRSKAWNTKKITAHHAIIPTGIIPSALAPLEEQIYLLIAQRYLLQFWPPMEFEATKLQVTLDNQTLWEATGKVIKNAGWTSVVRPDKEAEPPLPRVQKGDRVSCQDIDLQRKRTTPPAHFTEGTLIAAMKNIHRFVEDKKARAKLRESSGLGTEATRAGILEILKNRGYVQSKGKSLLATEKGQNVIDLCPHSMKDIVTTAILEDMLSDIQNGKVASKQAVSHYAKSLAPMLDEVFAQDTSRLPKLDYTACPLCSRALVRIKGKKSQKYFWICQNDACQALFSDEGGHCGQQILKPEISSEFTCPQCGKPLARRKRKDGSGSFFSCTGYPKCSYTDPDIDGKPGQPGPRAEISSEFSCPLCGKPLARRQRKDGSGSFFSCTGYPHCTYTAPDIDGKPGTPTAHPKPPCEGTFSCPLCGKPLVYGQARQSGQPYWACFNKSPKHGRKSKFFSVAPDGKPLFNESPQTKARKQ
ncbi:MAG: DNA topoisomerase 3 [Desulfovibrio sp.]|nr:DNA topoisomerase 3 [Desulfovibrio sp.]